MLGKRAVRRSDGLGDGSGLSAQFSAELHKQATELVLTLARWTDSPVRVVRRSLLPVGIASECLDAAGLPVRPLAVRGRCRGRPVRQLSLAEVRRQVCSGAGLGHPRMRLIGELGDLQQIVAAEGRRGLPGLAVLVRTLERDVEDNAFAGAIGPDGGLDPPEADLLDGACGLGVVLNIGHGVFSFFFVHDFH